MLKTDPSDQPIKSVSRIQIHRSSQSEARSPRVATAYVDCTACAPCKQLCVEYTTFAHKATYCVHIVQLLRVSDLLRMYTTCTLEATCAYDVSLVRVSNLLCTYSTTFARKRLIAYVYDLCARGDLCVQCTSCACKATYCVRIVGFCT